ncbi:MAG: TetR/AcrR family transcriptional regulator [Chloroflexi bacterium]|nr:TetR/AcrR family transcriptional regulator [Chloroflexota bacterium]
MLRTKRPAPDTAQRILEVAERLVQKRGFNGFSYADVARELGITTASLHYHFAGKAQLGEALLARYSERFSEALSVIDARPAAGPAKLEAYAELYADVLNGQRLCLCGMLAADYETLPKGMRQSVVTFFDENERWLTSILQKGREDGSLQYEGSAVDAARLIVSGLEGAMLVTRPYGDITRFRVAARGLLASLTRAGRSQAPAD